MNDFAQLTATFLADQAKRNANNDVEIAAMKAALLPHLALRHIALVEIRFDGGGDSGIIEECSCLDTSGKTVECPDIDIAREGRDAVKLTSLLGDFAYEALEQHHGG